MQTPPVAWTAADDRAEALVDRFYGADGRRDHAGVADHVGVGEVDDPEAGRSSRQAATNAAAAARALISGLRS